MAVEIRFYRMMLLLIVATFINGPLLSQIDSVKATNLLLIKNCDSGVNRDIYGVKKHNYTKALEYDIKIVDFLNVFNDTRSSMQIIKYKLKKIGRVFHYEYSLDSIKMERIQIITKGLIDLLITFKIINKKFTERQFILTVNNKGFKCAETSEYLRMIVPLFKFKLHLIDCYTFNNAIKVPSD